MPDQVSGILSPFLRYRRIAAARPFIKGSVIDVGCGTGKLAEYVHPDNYVGTDTDVGSISFARVKYPRHTFLTAEEAANIKRKFDTVVALAVIEHVGNPVEFAKYLRSLLIKDGLLVITTPHPCGNLILEIGSKFGIFSSEAHEEHEELLDERRLRKVAAESGLELIKAKRFLFGMNQLFVLRGK
jgi:2-polyprenyl-3-methyl-5-hydroxy-6-metoxy-1,4-benzoquinol methylase